MSTIFGIYLGSLLFGAILILSSIFMGDGDGHGDGGLDKDVDFHVDGDHDGGADAFGWLPILSLRFWTFFLGSFGLSGVMLSLLGTSQTTTLIAAIIMGIVIAYPAALLFQKLKSNTVTTNTTSTAYKQEIAKTLLPMQPNGQGKIRLSYQGELIDLIATNSSEEEISPNSEVMIMEMKDGVATVVPLQHAPRQTE